MKRAVAVLMTGTVLMILSAPAIAMPPFKKAFDEYYGKNADLKKASDEAKCNICHFGTSKKMKNDYCKALGEFLKKENFKPERFEKDAEAAKKEIEAALKRVEDMKSKGGEMFGDRLKAGKLPGTPES